MAGFIDVQVTIPDVQQMANRLSRAQVRTGVADAVRSWSQASVALLRARTPVRTGAMQRSWRADPLGDLGVRITNPVPYAIFVATTPTRAHEIRPRDPAGFLRFMIGDHTVFTPVVHHPGTQPDALLKEAVEQLPHTALDALLGVAQRLGTP